jgi:site-specific DNA recombinase
MKKRAIIYTRVSTDEQNNGYSPLDQRVKVEKYCENNAIEVLALYHDDESGKSFNRPEWINIMSFIKRNKGLVNYIIFLKWDRFSRNVAEAYITINELNKLGVTPLAIEQPLNLEIPESKLMLAFYLAAPEVDNDRRSLNILHGIRRGKKEGRWLGNCLRGYVNARDEGNKPIIKPEGGKKQRLIVKAFKDFSTGLYNIEELRHKINKQGLNISRSSFWEMLRNKGYIGKIRIPAYKDEPEEWVDGLHEPIIDEHTFYEVQNILGGRKKKIPNKNNTKRIEFPLRGFLKCSKCGKNLTGSGSRSCNGEVFYYYHCSKGCGERQKAQIVNEEFELLLKNYTSNEKSMRFYTEILKDKFKNKNKNNKQEIDLINKVIDKQNQRIANAKTLMLDGEFSAIDYKEMKLEIEVKIKTLQIEISKHQQGVENMGGKLDACLDLLKNLHKYYVAGDTEIKQRIISSIFPEKLVFEKKAYRTTKLNEAFALICNDNKPSSKNKNGKNLVLNKSSRRVVSPRIELGSNV